MKKLFKNYYINENESYKLTESDIFITDDIYVQKLSTLKIAKINDIKEMKKINFIIDFSITPLNLYSAKKLIKKIKRFSNILKLKKDKIGINQNGKIIIGNIMGLEQQYANDVLTALTLPLVTNKAEKYDLLYDNICWYLDNEFISKQLCGFKNNRCIGVSPENNECIGCCKHFRDKRFGPIYQSGNTMIPCEYLNPETKRCDAKCIMCKLVTCPAVKKKGYHFHPWNVLLINYYFNLIQKIIVISTAYTPKEKILKKLLFFSLK